MKKRKLFSIAMTLIMVIALVVALGVTASAAGAASVDICGVTLDATNSYLSYDPATTTYSATTTEAGALARFNAAESTLYLNGGINYSGTGNAIYANGDLTLNVTGTNSVTSTNNYAVVTSGNLTITGIGTLNVTAIGAISDAIWANDGDLNISGVTIVAAAGDQGLFSNYDMSITNASINVTSNSDGLYASDGDINITGGTVTVEGGQGLMGNDITISGADVTLTSTDDDAIEPLGDVSITDGASVEIYGEYGIYESGMGSNLLVENSSLTIDTTHSATYLSGEVVIVSSTVDVSTSYGSYGIAFCEDADNDGYGLEIVNSTVSVSGSDTAAIYCDGYYSTGSGIYISGSTVTATSEFGNGIYADNDMFVQSSTVSGTGDRYGIYVYDLTTSGNSVTGTATGEYGVGIDLVTMSISGGIVTGQGSGIGTGIALWDETEDPVTLSNGETVYEGGRLHRLAYTGEVIVTATPVLGSSDKSAKETLTSARDKAVSDPAADHYVWVYSTSDAPTYSDEAGFANSSMKVVIKPLNLDPVPKTGDMTGISMLFAIAAVTATGIAVLAKKKTEA